jgi:hypothetical protein
MSTHQYRRVLPALAVALSLATSSFAQTKIVAPSNKYAPADDVKLGQEAAAQVRKEMPLLNDERLDNYITDIGAKLAEAVPPEYRHPEFHFTFAVVNQKEINAFALPGGPMFLNRGMIEAAHTEGEVAGVMAHEMSHVVLRHGTAQATKGEKFQIGAIAGQVLGAIVGGTAGSIIAQGSQFGLSTYFMKFSREYESQADILGAQMMARAGYDPREMANMFKTIEAEGGSNGPEFLSDHPNPANRYAAITKEAQSLRVQGNANSGQFQNMQARIKGMGKSYTAEEIARGQAGSKGGNAPAEARTVRVAAPASQVRQYQPADFFRVSVPANWAQSGKDNGVTYAPEGAVFTSQGGASAFTHGVEFGVAQGGSGNLQKDTQSLLQSFARNNPDLRLQGGYQRDSLGGRAGITAQLSNTSDVTGQPEYIALTTTQLRNGNLLFMIGVAPQTEANTYESVFRNIRRSVRISDR